MTDNLPAPSRRQALAGIAALGLAGCSTPPSPPQPTASPPTLLPPSAPPSSTTGRLNAYGVSSGHPLASQAGLKTLSAGGTAVDAAIAAAFADAVLQPASSGIGGGGVSIVVRDGRAQNYDYREVVNRAGRIPRSGTGIPGFVAGMAALHRDHGRLPWSTLLQPAIALASDGAPVSRYLADTINAPLGRRVTKALPHFHASTGKPLTAGQRLIQAELARTMQQLARDGEDYFYRGAFTRALTQVEGLDASSLNAYRLQVSQPASGPVGSYTMLSGAPALPGAAIIQMVQVAQAAGIGDLDPDSAAFIDVQSQAWQIADQSVQTLFGDPAFVTVPVARLTDPAANADLARSMKRRPTARIGPKYTGAPNTTHISVVDAHGTAVSMTNTITNYWGSGQYVGGFFLNDQIGRFGDIGTTRANTPSPGRRSVTWSSPSMLLDDQSRPALVIGAPGGRQIPNTTASVVLRWALHHQSLPDAVRAPRFILDEGDLRLEAATHRNALTRLGYRARVTAPSTRANYGSVQALDVSWGDQAVRSYADPRRSAGYAVATGTPPPP
ncbi:gamma-glutamyltransferase [Luteipulveratus halotolerans]|nr:gamma-glutamyltransferase [Luteipulveratus halotolerans]